MTPGHRYMILVWQSITPFANRYTKCDTKTPLYDTAMAIHYTTCKLLYKMWHQDTTIQYWYGNPSPHLQTAIQNVTPRHHYIVLLWQSITPLANHYTKCDTMTLLYSTGTAIHYTICKPPYKMWHHDTAMLYWYGNPLQHLQTTIQNVTPRHRYKVLVW